LFVNQLKSLIVELYDYELTNFNSFTFTQDRPIQANTTLKSFT